MCWAGDDDLDFEELAISIKSVEGESSSSTAVFYTSQQLTGCGRGAVTLAGVRTVYPAWCRWAGEAASDEAEHAPEGAGAGAGVVPVPGGLAADQPHLTGALRQVLPQGGA